MPFLASFLSLSILSSIFKVADPIAVCASVAAAAKVVYQSSVSTYSFIESSIHIDQSVLALLNEFSSLKNVSFAIGDTVSSPSIRDNAWLDDGVQEVFSLLESSLKRCDDSLRSFKATIDEIRTGWFTNKLLRQSTTQAKLDLKSSRIVLLRGQIYSHLSAMQLGLQTINLSASLRGPELVIDVLGSKLNEDMNNLSNKVDDKLKGFDMVILHRMDDLERLITRSNQRINTQYTHLNAPTIPILENETQLKEVAVRTVSSARSVVSFRSTAAEGSATNYSAYTGLRNQDSSICGSCLCAEKLQGITQWTSGLEVLADGSKTSIGLESSNWTVAANDSDSEDDIDDDTFNALAERGECYYNGGKVAEAEIIFRKALKLANTSNLRSRSAQKHNDIILRLASIYFEQKKFLEAKEVLTYLFSTSKVDLSLWEAQQKIKGAHLLAKALLELNELLEAEIICKDAMRARRRTFGKNSTDYRESLELLMVITEALGDVEPTTRSPSSDARSRSGRTSVLSGFSKSLQSTPPMYIFGRAQPRPQSRISSAHLELGSKSEITVNNTTCDTELKDPSPMLQEVDVSVENVTTSLPEKATRAKASGITTPISLPDGSELTAAFSSLETNDEYNFMSSMFQPQAALMTAINKRDTEVVWILLNSLANVEKRYQENFLHKSAQRILEKPEPFPPKLNLDYVDDKGPLLFQALWPDSNSSADTSIVSKQYEIARMLLNAGSNPNVKWSKVTPLLKASRSAQWDFVRIFLEAGADVNCKDEKDQTALHYAFLYEDSSNEEIVCQLVEKGADLDIVFDMGQLEGPITTLTHAALYGWEKATKTFLAHGANTERNSGIQFISPLGVAAYKGFTVIAKILLDGGANIEGSCFYDDKFATPLWIATRKRHLDMIELLLARGANIEAANTEETDTPLSIASKMGFKDTVEILLQHGASVKARDSNSRTPLYFACRKGHVDVVHILLRHGAEVNSQSRTNTTPLIAAAIEGHMDVVSKLLQNKANANAKDVEGYTALFRATINSHDEIVQQLIEYGADIELATEDGNNPLLAAAATGNLSILELLIDKGAKIEVRDETQYTPLFWAAGNGNIEVVRTLVKSGADIEAICDDEYRPLHIASENGHHLVVQILVDEGAQLEATEYSGFSALYKAARAGHLECVQILYERGAKVNAKGFRSLSPLLAAVKYEHLSVVKFLLEKGADVNGIIEGAGYYDEGWTALKCAVIKENEELEKNSQRCWCS